MGNEGLGILGTHQKKKKVCTQGQNTLWCSMMIKQPNKQNHHPKQLKSNVPRFQNKGKQFRVGQWKQPYPPEDHGKTTSMPVIGDHSVLQNIKLFHCKSMETMS